MNKNVLDKFINKYKENYPHLTESELRVICEAPFRLMRETMKDDLELPEIRFKYLGVFKPHIRNLFGYIHRLDAALKKGTISKENYIRVKAAIEIKIEELKRKKDGQDSLD